MDEFYWEACSVETSGSGLLIQTWVGSSPGLGRPRGKRSGWARNAAARTVDRAVVGAISRQLEDDDIAAILRELRKRIDERSRTTNSEIPRIEAELPKLRREVENMAEAIAVTGGKIDVW